MQLPPDQPTTLLRELRNLLSPKNRESFDRLAERPEVKKVIAAGEKEHLAERAAKIKRLGEIEGKFRSPIEAAVKRFKNAEDLEKVARFQLNAAQAETVAAQVALQSIDGQCVRAQGELEMEIRRESDPRLQVAIHLLNNLISHWIPRAFAVGVQPDPKNDRRGVVVSNAEDSMVAMQAVRSAVQECSAMQLESLSSAAIEERLADIFARVGEAARPLRIFNVPEVRDGLVVTGSTYGRAAAEA